MLRKTGLKPTEYTKYIMKLGLVDNKVEYHRFERRIKRVDTKQTFKLASVAMMHSMYFYSFRKARNIWARYLRLCNGTPNDQVRLGFISTALFFGKKNTARGEWRKVLDQELGFKSIQLQIQAWPSRAIPRQGVFGNGKRLVAFLNYRRTASSIKKL